MIWRTLKHNLQRVVIEPNSGRALCSERDPLREAEKWVEHCGKLDVFDEAWIVGVGAAYHIEALKRHYPHLKLTCMTHFPLEKLQVKEELGRFIQLNEVVTQSIFFDDTGFVKGPILLFRPAAHQFDLEFAEELRARLKNGFVNQAAQLGFTQIAERVANGVLQTAIVNIHELKKVCRPNTKEDKLVYALNELVK